MQNIPQNSAAINGATESATEPEDRYDVGFALSLSGKMLEEVVEKLEGCSVDFPDSEQSIYARNTADSLKESIAVIDQAFPTKEGIVELIYWEAMEGLNKINLDFKALADYHAQGDGEVKA